MYISSQAVEMIRSFVSSRDGGWTESNEAVAAAANEPTTANPAPRPVVPTPYTYDDLLAVISDATAARLIALPSLPAIVEAVNSGDLAACARWISSLVRGGVVTIEEAAAIQAVVAAVEPDPAWPPLVSWAESVLGRPATIADVQAARDAENEKGG